MFSLALPATLTEGYEEPIPGMYLPAPRIASAYISVSPITKAGNWTAKNQTVKRSSSSGNCIARLKQTGALPNQSVTTDGFARTVPTKPVELRPGMKRVVCTTEGVKGHCLEIWVNPDGLLISITEDGHPVGAGRVVDPNVIIGEVDKDKL